MDQRWTEHTNERGVKRITFIGSVKFTCSQKKTYFSQELQKVAEDLLDWSLYLKIKNVSLSGRDIIVSML